MEVEVEVEVKLEHDDLVALNMFYLQYSREARRLRRRAHVVSILGVLLVVAIILGLLYYTELIETVFQAVLALALYMVLFVPVFIICDRVLLKRRIRRLVVEGQDRSLLAPNTWSLSEDNLSFEGEFSSGRISWKAVEDVVERDEHIFICLGKQRALVLPRRVFATAEEAKHFLELAREHQAAHASAASG